MASLSLSVFAFQLLAPSATSTPNFLLLFPDEWRWDWAGFDEPNLRVPTVTSLAENGTRFTHAYVPSPVCDPSRSAMASGKEYDESGVPSNEYDYPTNETTWYSVLQAAGYHTMTTGKDDLSKATGVNLDGSFHAAALGFSDWIRTMDKNRVVMDDTAIDPYGAVLENYSLTDRKGRKTTAFEIEHRCVGNGNCCVTVGKGKGAYESCSEPDFYGDTTIADELYLDNWVADSAVALLDRKPSGKPWVLHVSFPGPHPPFIITQSMNESIAGRSFPLAADNTVLDSQSQTEIRQQYAAEIENLDSLFKKIIEKVTALGELDNTIIVVASDHGDELGDHGKFGKSRPWEGSAHVPLIVKGPGVQQGKTVGTPVATLDLPGTFFDYAGASAATGMTTQSLRPLLDADGNAADYRTAVTSGLDSNIGNFRMVVKQFNSSYTLKLVCCEGSCPAGPSTLPTATTDMQLLLFNSKTDTTDMTNLLEQGLAEATELVDELPSSFASKCKASLAAVKFRSNAVTVV